MNSLPIAVVGTALLALGPGTRAQERLEPSEPVSGIALRQDGSAWGDAVVTLNSLSWRLPSSSTFQHRIDVRVDEDGSFQSTVTIGRTYSAWALSAVKADRYTVSEVASGASAGHRIQLQENEDSQQVVAVEVLGLEAWREQGPFSFEAVCVISDRFVVECELDQAGRALIPPMPDAALFRVRSDAGAVVAEGMIPLKVEARREAAVGDAEPRRSTTSLPATSFVTISEALTRVTVAPPVLLQFEVRGPRKPISGARLYGLDRADRRLLVETDKSGRAEWPVPSDWSDPDAHILRRVSLWVEAPGFTTVHWFTSDLATTDEDGEPRVHTISVPRGHSIEGRLSWSRGRAAADTPILVHTGTPSGTRLSGQTATFDGAPRITWTDAKGRFEIDGLAPHASWQLSTILGPEAAFLRSSEIPLAPAVVLAFGEDSSKKTQKLGTITVSSFRPIDVSVSGAERDAGVTTDLDYRGALNSQMQEENVASVRLAPDGRIRLLAQPKSRLLLSVPNHDPGASDSTQALDVKPGKRPVEVSLSIKGR